MLLIPESSRVDAGKYEITLENSAGKKSADIHVRVLDSPGPPLNLKPVKIDKESITLQWDIPLIDGGAKITNYIIEKRESTRKAFATAITKCPTTSVRIGDLGEGCEYYFRVSAENEFGIGEAVETTDPIRASQTPTPPESIIPTDITKNSVSLAWTKPKHDGGSRISGYVLEAKKKGTDQWAHVTTVKTMDFTVKNLNENEEYIFHVMAVNQSGRSAPRESKPIIVKDSTSLPEFDLRGVCQKTVIAKAGDDIKVEIPVMGRPRPTISWQKDGAALKLTQRINVETTAATVIISISECTRADSGVYTMTAKNIVGSVTENIIIKVHDIPGPPKGPVKIVEISRTYCYHLERKERNSILWVKLNKSLITDQTFKTTGLEPGMEYEYRVYAENIVGIGKASKVSEGHIARDPCDPPGTPEATKITKDSITIVWTKPEYDGGAKVTGYIVEKKELPEGRWLKANFTNVIETEYVATGLVQDNQYEFRENQTYKFRVCAINKVGVGEHADLSGAVVVQDRTEEPDLDIDPELRKIVSIKAGASLRLFIPIKGRPIPTIKWDKDEEALKETAQVEITSSYTSLVIDKMSRNDSGKYTVTAQNSSGTKSAFVVVRVLDTPSAPVALKVKEITNQSVTLAWEPPLLDGGSKIKNYIIEKRESTRKTYAAVVTNCHALSCKIEPLQEGCSYYFRVLAENTFGVGLPAATVDPLKVSEVPQSPKSLTVTDQTKTSISLAWDRPEYDGGSRVQQYLLEVQLKGQDKWSGVNTFKTMETTVSNLNPGQEYLFRVTAINDKGKSDPKALAGPVMTKDLVFEPDIRPAFSSYSVHVGKDMNVDIPIFGRPKPTIAWTKDGAPLKFTTRVNIHNTTTHTTLSIKEATKYEYRVYAENIGCVARDPCDPPGTPEAVHVTKDTIVIQWTKPEYDGGSNITGYIIEKRDLPEGRWVRANFTNVIETQFTVSGLTENAQYDFRVFAKNSVGTVSKPSYNSGPITASDKVESPKYSIDPAFTKTVIVNAGETFRLDADVRGKPLPSVQWFKDEKPVENTIRLEIKNTESHGMIIVKDLTPGQPHTPEVNTATKTTMLVEWDKPGVDGGSPVIGYYLERRDKKSLRWIRVYKDPITDIKQMVYHLTEGNEYQYRVCAINKAGEGPFSDVSDYYKAADPVGM
uniref:Titin n=1 Tax=Xiphophorus couchianus TaxID=32473 RepID=A0A3B5M7E1_9TELE